MCVCVCVFVCLCVCASVFDRKGREREYGGHKLTKMKTEWTNNKHADNSLGPVAKYGQLKQACITGYLFMLLVYDIEVFYHSIEW